MIHQVASLLTLRGRILVVARDQFGNVKRVVDKANLIVNNGKAAVAGLMNGVVTTPQSWIAIGTGSTAPTTADTQLQAEITTGGGQRALATLSRVTTTSTNDTAQWQYTWTFTLSFTVSEAGLFNQLAVGGTMLSRQTFTGIPVVATDTIQITWQIQVL